MSFPMFRSVAVFPLVATLLVSGPVFAQDRSKALFDEARDLVEKGQFTEACPKFEESQKLKPGVGTLFNLADCNEKIGKTKTAREQFLDVARITKDAGQSEREEAARARAQALESQVPKLQLELPENVNGLEIRVDGKIVPSADWAAPIAMDPGTYSVTATGAGRTPFESTVTLTPEGGLTAVDIAIGPSSGVETQDDDGEEDDDEAGASRINTGAVITGGVVLGLGVLNLAAGIGAFVQLREKSGSEKDVNIAFGIVALGLSGVGIGVGLPILIGGLTSDGSEEAAADHAQLVPELYVTPMLGPDGAAIGGAASLGWKL